MNSCEHCEDKQHAINALTAYVKRLTNSNGSNREYVDRCILEHRVEELCSDDFASVYFSACDLAIEMAKKADGLAATLKDVCG